MDPQQYFKMRKYTTPGTEEYKSLQEKAKKQKPLRKLIEKKMEPVLQEFARTH